MEKKLNKHMPYSVPDGFFDRLESDVWAELKSRGTEAEAASGPTGRSGAALNAPHAAHATATHRTAVLTIMAAAASLLLLFTLHTPRAEATAQGDGLEQVDRAFAQLSPADQRFLLEVYADGELIDSASDK